MYWLKKLQSLLGTREYHWALAQKCQSALTQYISETQNRLPVFQLHDILVWSGFGSADPCLWPVDPDPAIFVIDLEEADKK